MSSRCGKALNVLSVKRSLENRNSLNEQFRTIQVVRSVSCDERCRERRMAPPSSPPEQKTASCWPRPFADTHCDKPRSTRVQNSVHDSTEGSTTSPSTHLVISNWNIFSKFSNR